MDIGCRFFTPKEISDDIACHAGEQEFVVDLFAGVGNLYKAFLKRKYASEALALDINPLILQDNEYNGNVSRKIVDCLNPSTIRNELAKRNLTAITFVLNPPFKRISINRELSYWKQFNDFTPPFLTQRVECIAIAAAIQAAPINSVFYVIIPQIILESTGASAFFETLKTYYSMSLISAYKRARFSSAEVDVAVIRLRKNCQSCITNVIDRHATLHSRKLENRKHDSQIIKFELFRGKVRKENERKHQISVKHLKIGGVTIRGKKLHSDLLLHDSDKHSINGDILIARVGPRMIGRIGKVYGSYVFTNESIVTLRIFDPKLRKIVYKALRDTSFIGWCKAAARGTANYFLTMRDIKDLINKIIS